MLLSGVVGVGVIFFLLLGWSAYVFYDTVEAEKQTPEVPPSQETLSAKDINGVVEKLDLRATELEKLLGK